jgi:hypothetical protein
MLGGVSDVAGELDAALASGEDAGLRAVLLDGSRLPGPRLNLGLVQEFARCVAAVVLRPEPPVDALEGLLDGWAALTPEEAPGDAAAVILPCAAVAAYGAVAVARPDWWSDELAKLRRAAADDRWRVRELVATALQHVLGSDWDRTVVALLGWADDADPLVVRAAAAAVAEPRLLRDAGRAAAADAVQRHAVARLAAVPLDQRRRPDVRVLRQALGFTLGVVAAASGDLTLLDELSASTDADLQWIARDNVKKARLRRRASPGR